MKQVEYATLMWLLTDRPLWVVPVTVDVIPGTIILHNCTPLIALTWFLWSPVGVLSVRAIYPIPLIILIYVIVSNPPL